MKVLLAVDGSDHSHEAVHALKYLVHAEEVHLVHVLDVPTPGYPMPNVTKELYETAERTMREDGGRLLDRMKALLLMDAGPVTQHLITGAPADQIVTLAEQHKMDVILLGTRGLGPIKERLIGSVAHRVLTFAPGAKFILPGPLKSLKQVLLPLQETYDADQALRFLQQNIFREPPTITLFTVLPDTQPPWPVDAASAEQDAQLIRDAKDFLEDRALKIEAMGYHTRVATALGTPVEKILQKAKALNSDLILMGSRGRRGLTRLVLGSVSHALLHHGTYPLMIFS